MLAHSCLVKPVLLSLIVDQVCAGHSQSCIWGDCNAECFRDSARALLLCREVWATGDSRDAGKLQMKHLTT